MARIEKVDAAERLIIAAIGMVDRGEDPLASHLLATSALNVLRDIIEGEGHDYVTKVITTGMFTLAQARAQGEELGFDVPLDAVAQLDDIANAIAAGAVKSPDDLGLAHEKPWELLNYLIHPTNFLKHADRDPLAALDEASFDPVGALGHALAAYTMVRSDYLPETFRVFMEQHNIA